MYKDELAQNPDMIVIDGSLVDIMDTLVQNGKLNEPLYEAMVEAQDKGENIYLYSAFYSKDTLENLGVDLEKFPILNKSQFTDPWSNYMVLGKIVDDKDPKRQFSGLKMSDDNNYIFPNVSSYEFSRNTMPEGIENEVMSSPKKMILDNRAQALRMEERRKAREAGGGENRSRRDRPRRERAGNADFSVEPTVPGGDMMRIVPNENGSIFDDPVMSKLMGLKKGMDDK